MATLKDGSPAGTRSSSRFKPRESILERGQGTF